MRTAMIWPGPAELQPCGLFASDDHWHVVAAMTTDARGVIVKLAAHCGAFTTAPATWTNLATVRSAGQRVCPICDKAAEGQGGSAAPTMLPDHLIEKLRRQAQAEGQSLEALAEEMLAYRARRNHMRIAACRRGARKG